MKSKFKTLKNLTQIFLFKIILNHKRYVALPIGLYFGIKKDENESNSEEIKLLESTLEKYYKSCKKPSASILHVNEIIPKKNI